MQGVCDELARIAKKTHGLDVNPLTDIAICCGQTEAFAAAVFSGTCLHVCIWCCFPVSSCNVFYDLDLIVINPGDEVIIFDPSFDTYANVVSIAGGVPVSYHVSRLKLIPLISKTDFPADFELIMNRYM